MRANLDVVCRAFATRIRFEGRRAVGVEYLRRGKQIAEGLHDLGWEVDSPPWGNSVWVRVPFHFHAMRFASMLLRKAGIAVIPGVVYGEFGHDSIRIMLAQPTREIAIALDRLHHKLPRRWASGAPGAGEESHR